MDNLVPRSHLHLPLAVGDLGTSLGHGLKLAILANRPILFQVLIPYLQKSPKNCG